MTAMLHSKTAAIVWASMIVLACLGYGACITIACDSGAHSIELVAGLIPVVNSYWWIAGSISGTGSFLSIVLGIFGTIAEFCIMYLLLYGYLREYEEIEEVDI